MKFIKRFVVAAILIGVSSHALGDEVSLPSEPLMEVVAAVAKKTDRTILVDHRVPPSVVLGNIAPRNLSYSDFLIVLRNNDLAAVAFDETTSVVPVQIVRQYPLPVIYEEDDERLEEEWVTWVVKLQHSDGRRLVPILRPLLPQAGHLAADPASKTLVLADRYGNARRVVEMIRGMDTSDVPSE